MECLSMTPVTRRLQDKLPVVAKGVPTLATRHRLLRAEYAPLRGCSAPGFTLTFARS
jgi:hypothetical protein